MAMAVLAAAPIPTQVFTVTIASGGRPNVVPASIVVSTSISYRSQLFEDEKEILASIITFNNDDGTLL